MQAIETKYLGPTNFRGARIKASAQAGSITVPYDHALNYDENHIAAARALVERFAWLGSSASVSDSQPFRSWWLDSWYSGRAVKGDTFVHVPSDGGPAFTVRAARVTR